MKAYTAALSMSENVQYDGTGESPIFTQEEFGLLFEQYRHMVFITCVRVLGNVDAAEDMVQETFLRAMRKQNHMNDPCAFAGWIRTIAHRLAMNRVIREKITRQLEVFNYVDDKYGRNERDELAVIMNVDEQLLTDERDAIIAGSICQLSDFDSRTLRQYHFSGDFHEGERIALMAHEEQCPKGTIKRRLHVARGRLKELLLQKGIDGMDV